MAMTPATVFVFVLGFSGLLGVAQCDTPKWPDKYTVCGTLQLPYAEIKEPFCAYYDKKSNKSRIDYYPDTVKTYQFAGSQPKNLTFGVQYKVAYMANDTLISQQTCFQVNGTNTSEISIQAVLPDLTGFKKVGPMMIGGKNTTKWQNETVFYGRTNTYIMYIEDGTNHPVRYEMHGFNSLLGSHYDRYYLDYSTFAVNFSDDAWKIPANLTCGGFPGPGEEEHKVLVNPMAEYIHGQDEHVNVMFEKFTEKHNRKYRDFAEHGKRKMIFRDNIRFVHSTNRAGLSYKVALNHLADLTSAEMAVMRGRKRSKGYNGGLPFNKDKFNLNTIPDHLDWRNFGAVTQVKDQAVCGSCWSFGTTGHLEGAYFMRTGKLVRLSQQELMDCSWGEGNNACDGGEDFRSYQWIMKHGGLSTEDEYGPYKAADGICHAKNNTGLVKISGYVNVTSNDLEALKIAIAKRGPISVGIDASHKSLSFYSHGVYYEPKCGNTPDDLDHAVLAVGYGVQNGQPYWLVKNSWSTYWGNNGYVLMSQRNNNCGVASAATYVLM